MERENKLRTKLDPKICRAYAEQYRRITPSARRQLFTVSMHRRLFFQTKTNERWVEIVRTAKRVFERREAYLLTRMTPLPQYYKVTRRRVQIEQKTESRLGKFCRRSQQQQTLSSFVMRWEAPPWEPGSVVQRVLEPVRERTDESEVTDRVLPTGKKRTQM